MPASPFRGPYPLSSKAASGYWQVRQDNRKCPKAEEDKSSSEHSSAEGRGHVSEASLALEPWAAVDRLKPGVLGGGTT